MNKILFLSFRDDHFVTPVLHLLNSKNLDVDFKEVY